MTQPISSLVSPSFLCPRLHLHSTKKGFQSMIPGPTASALEPVKKFQFPGLSLRCLISSGVRPSSRCSNAWTTLKTTSPDWPLQRSQEREPSAAMGPQTCICSNRCSGRGSPGLRPTLGAQLGYLWSISLLSEEPSGWGVRASKGKALE